MYLNVTKRITQNQNNAVNVHTVLYSYFPSNKATSLQLSLNAVKTKQSCYTRKNIR